MVYISLIYIPTVDIYGIYNTGIYTSSSKRKEREAKSMIPVYLPLVYIPYISTAGIYISDIYTNGRYIWYIYHKYIYQR